MKFDEAKEFIHRKSGFRISFEKREDGVLVSDYFPDGEEPGIPTEEGAWCWASKFANAGKDDGIVNVYVIHADDFVPVDSYNERKLSSYL